MRSTIARSAQRLTPFVLSAGVAFATATPTIAQQRAPGPAPAPQQQTQAPQPTAPQVKPPSIETILTLVRGSMIALAQAHMTNNYSVLRDLGAPGFQAANSPQKLSEIFTSVRNQGVDIGVILIVPPELTQQPLMDKNGMLRLTGYFPTSPRVNFDLLYVPVGNTWRHFGMSMSLTQPTPVASNTPAPSAPPGAAPKKSASSVDNKADPKKKAN